MWPDIYDIKNNPIFKKECQYFFSYFFIFMCRYFKIKYEGTKEKLMKIKKYYLH